MFNGHQIRKIKIKNKLKQEQLLSKTLKSISTENNNITNKMDLFDGLNNDSLFD